MPLCLFLPMQYFVCIFSTFDIFRWWKVNHFQLHLSTLLVVTAMTGVLVGLNIKPIRVGNEIGWPFFPINPICSDINGKRTIEGRVIEENEALVYDRYAGFPITLRKPWDRYADWSDCAPLFFLDLFVWSFNLAMCLAMLVWTIYFLETKFERAVKTQ